MGGGGRARSKARGLGPRPSGVRGFESHPPHHLIAIVLLVLLALSLSSTVAPAVLQTDGCSRPSYRMRVEISPSLDTVSGWEEVAWQNCGGEAVSEIHMRLYPNAFSSSGGRIEVQSVSSPGRSATSSVGGPDNTVLEVSLDPPVAPGERVTIEIEFIVHVPEVNDRFGRSGGVLALGNWFPILSVLRDGSWVDHPYFHDGECFFSESSDFLVELVVPEDLVVAATGELTSESQLGDGRVVQTWVARGVRDFAVVASPRFEVSRERVGGVTVYSYYLPEHAEGGERVLEYAVNAIRVFSNHFTPYSFTAFRVAEVHGWFGGMEYPQLIMVSSSFYEGDERTLEMIVAHETAHQWWYSIVGNDQWEEPWLDESLAEYSQILYFEWVYDPENAEMAFWDFVGNPYRFYLDSGEPALPVAVSVGEVADDPGRYRAAVYLRGAWALRMLREILGDEAFFRALRMYAEENAFGVATGEDLVSAFEESWGGDLDWFFEEWVYEGCVPSYRVADVGWGAEGAWMEVYQALEGCNGGAPKSMPVEFKVDPCGRVVSWINSTWVNVSLPEGCEPKVVLPDPDDGIPGADVGWSARNDGLPLTSGSGSSSENPARGRMSPPVALALILVGAALTLALVIWLGRVGSKAASAGVVASRGEVDGAAAGI